jgi:hypothetical protein
MCMCVLPSSCCMLYAVCCMLYAVCCMLYAVCCTLYAVCCVLLSYSFLLVSLLCRHVSDELNKMRMKEKYLNNQHNTMGLAYIEVIKPIKPIYAMLICVLNPSLCLSQVKHKLEELERKSSSAHESVAKLTNDLAEVTEKLDDLKESFESKDSGLHDTSPLVKIKAGLQQIKSDIHSFDMRIGVVAHSLLAARVNDHNRLRASAVTKNRPRHNKQKNENDDNSLLSGDD